MLTVRREDDKVLLEMVVDTGEGKMRITFQSTTPARDGTQAAMISGWLQRYIKNELSRLRAVAYHHGRDDQAANRETRVVFDDTWEG